MWQQPHSYHLLAQGCQFTVPVSAPQWKPTSVFPYIAKEAIHHQHLGRLLCLYVADIRFWQKANLVHSHQSLCHGDLCTHSIMRGDTSSYLQDFSIIDSQGSSLFHSALAAPSTSRDFDNSVSKSPLIPKVFCISVHRFIVHLWIYLGIPYYSGSSTWTG